MPDSVRHTKRLKGRLVGMMKEFLFYGGTLWFELNPRSPGMSQAENIEGPFHGRPGPGDEINACVYKFVKIFYAILHQL